MKWWVVAAVLLAPALVLAQTPERLAQPPARTADADRAQPTDNGGWLGVMFVIEGDKNRVVITDTQPNGPAATAKLQAGDVIVKVGDLMPKSAQEFTDHIAKLNPGEKLTMTIMRDGKEQKIDITLGQRPGFRPLRPIR
jgi:S1-C subfamily serine protease